MIATSEMGQLQTVFYIVLTGGTIVLFSLFLVGVGLATLPAVFRRPGQRLLASLIAGALVFTFSWILVVSAGIIYAVSRRA
ncbi:MAG TPA: hypothetical protein VGR61_05750 [Candidatus Dormibacteraeota bacterium]|nr:hypothetical protein [Candidatus Dormibacteraeota bacterium]